MRLHDEGKRFPKSASGVGYAELLGLALRQEFGDRRFATKTVGRWTQASERTIKNWFSGTTLPTGDHLIRLIARSDAALEMVLAASRRTELLDAFYDLSRRTHAMLHTQRVTNPVTDRVTNLVTGRGQTDAVDVVRKSLVSKSERCSWFVAELAAGNAPGLAALQTRFGISARTAKRDVATMRSNGTVKYQGNTRRGRYVIAEPAD